MKFKNVKRGYFLQYFFSLANFGIFVGLVAKIFWKLGTLKFFSPLTFVMLVFFNEITMKDLELLIV